MKFDLIPMPFTTSQKHPLFDDTANMDRCTLQLAVSVLKTMYGRRAGTCRRKCMLWQPNPQAVNSAVPSFGNPLLRVSNLPLLKSDLRFELCHPQTLDIEVPQLHLIS